MENVELHRWWLRRTSVAALALILLASGALIGLNRPAQAQATTEVDLALIVTKRGLQEHVVDISVNPPKVHLQILVKNQGSNAATNIEVAHRIPDGMQFALLSAPALPSATLAGTPATVTRSSDELLVIELLGPGEAVAIDVTLDVLDKAPGRFVNEAEIVAMTGPDGEPAHDSDSTPDAIAGNDPIEVIPGRDADDPQNSHNDIDNDQTADGQSFPTPNDEDDHDAEVVVVPPVVNIALFLDPATETPLAPGQPVTFLVGVASVGAPAESLELLHQLDARAWEPFAPADNAVQTVEGRDIEWSFEDAGVVATVTGSLPNGARDLVPITLTPASTFSGDAGDLRHGVTVRSLDDEPPYVAAFEGSVDGGIIEAAATAEMLDVALRLTVDNPASDLPPLPDSAIVLDVEVTNQGSVAASGLRVFSHIDHDSWQRFSLSENPPTSTSGDVALGVAWETDEFGAEATLNGPLLPGQTVSFPVTLRISDGFVDPFGYLSTEAEVSAVTAISVDGVELQDVDSEPDEFNFDATVDDVIDNSGGDEDDHDTAFIDQRFAVGNQAWVDSDGNGLRGDDEDALVGLELELYKVADDLGADVTASHSAPSATTTTDEQGMFLFDGLAPGAYVIRVSDSARDVGGVAFGLSPTTLAEDLTQDAPADGDGDNDARVDDQGRIVAGPFVLQEGVPLEETPRNDSTTIDPLDDLTIDLGLVPLQSTDGSQDPDQQNPPQLAFTGAAHRMLILFGLFLVVSGAVAVRVSGRR